MNLRPLSILLLALLSIQLMPIAAAEADIEVQLLVLGVNCIVQERAAGTKRIDIVVVKRSNDLSYLSKEFAKHRPGLDFGLESDIKYKNSQYNFKKERKGISVHIFKIIEQKSDMLTMMWSRGESSISGFTKHIVFRNVDGKWQISRIVEIAVS
ncbi:MAG TPA: hypothetical protein VK968_16935 [Roseimicrobium sp.]|nr:hypothetical protein [Roseimicrobium sp.]